MIRRITGGLLRRYGQAVVLYRKGSAPQEGRAFVQPVLGRGQETPQERPTALGTAAERRHRYIGLLALEAGDRVEALGRAFRVRAAEPVFFGGKCVYWWALLETEDEEDTCG